MYKLVWYLLQDIPVVGRGYGARARSDVSRLGVLESGTEDQVEEEEEEMFMTPPETLTKYVWISNMLYRPNMFSRWLDTGQVLLKAQKRKRPISCNHEWTSLVNKGFVLLSEREIFSCGSNAENPEWARSQRSLHLACSPIRLDNKQLLGEVFVISGIITVEVSVISKGRDW